MTHSASQVDGAGPRDGFDGRLSHVEEQALRFLGHRDQRITPQVRRLVGETMARCEQVARPRHVERTFCASEVTFPGKDIARHLDGAREVVLMALTLGHGVDQELRRLSLTDTSREVVFDAVASAMVERLADKVEADIRAKAAERGLFCSWRFSPGYGDLPLAVQPALLGKLDAARRLGVTLTDSNLMVPTKSVSAIVGIHPTPQPGVASSCGICDLEEFCGLRSRGITCRGPR